MSTPPRLFYNNDMGEATTNVVRSPSPHEAFLYELVGRFAGTGIDAIAHDMFEGSDVVPSYPTQVPEARRILFKTFQSVGEWRDQVGTEWIIEHDPWPEAIEATHQAGMQFWSSMRFNDIHTPRWQSEFRANHPEYVLGDKCPSVLHGVRPEQYFMHATCRGFNYAIPEVRAHRFKMIEEVCTRYDLDGFEWDFTRHFGHHCPSYEEARPILTEYVRQVRELLNRIGKDRGRALGFGVRVMGPVQMCCDLGTDVKTWIEEGLVDYVSPIPGGGSVTNPFFREFVDIARDTDCRIYACTTEHLDARWRTDGCRSTPAPVQRAGAYNAWRQGVDGIYCMNFQITFPRNRHEDTALLSELAHPESLAFGDKRYMLTARHNPPQLAVHEYQLPLEVDVTPGGPGRAVCFEVGDDLRAAAELGILDAVTLQLTVSEPTDEEVVYKLNGRTLPENPIVDYPANLSAVGGRDQRVLYQLSGPGWIRQGSNELQVIVQSREPSILSKFTLCDLALDIRYRVLARQAGYPGMGRGAEEKQRAE